jgi:hypothetical protein
VQASRQAGRQASRQAGRCTVVQGMLLQTEFQISSIYARRRAAALECAKKYEMSFELQ